MSKFILRTVLFTYTVFPEYDPIFRPAEKCGIKINKYGIILQPGWQYIEGDENQYFLYHTTAVFLKKYICIYRRPLKLWLGSCLPRLVQCAKFAAEPTAKSVHQLGETDNSWSHSKEIDGQVLEWHLVKADIMSMLRLAGIKVYSQPPPPRKGFINSSDFLYRKNLIRIPTVTGSFSFATVLQLCTNR